LKHININQRVIRGSLWFNIYDALYRIGLLFAHILSLFNDKLKKSLEGSKGGVDNWDIGETDDRPIVLIHAASYGEFEGVIPLIEGLNYSGKCQVAVSFSSPSAEKTVSNTKGIIARGYLPRDLLYEQLKLLGRLEPSVILITKHDFWPNMIRAAKALDIPVIIINGNFHSGTKRLLPIVRSFHRSFMKHIKAVWTVSEADALRIEPLLSGVTELSALGDTRFDRVRQRAVQGKKRFSELKKALQSEHVFIAGSAWQPGERLCWDAFQSIVKDFPDAKLVIVPHEPTKEALRRNTMTARERGLSISMFSEWKGENIDSQALLVNEMGVLADLYTVGWAAYVGGGFGAGVHSVIEPAAHGIPVAFGPNHYVSYEAGLLINNGGGFVVRTVEELEKLWRDWLKNDESYNNAKNAASEVVKSREGVTKRILEMLSPYIG
jgi:3-deoxy-D-manno-octulosonic-acid transferase